MQIKAGFSLTYDCPQPTPMLLALSIHPSRRPDLLTPQVLRFSPKIEPWDYLDVYGNVCTRITAPAGQLTISAAFKIYDAGLPDIVPTDARQHDISDLPDDTLVYLLGSRYCETDKWTNIAWAFSVRPLRVGRASRLFWISCINTLHSTISRQTLRARRSGHTRTGRAFAVTLPIWH